MSESFPEFLGYLEARRSVPALQMSEPGPSSDELGRMLKIAARVPDHGKLAPWRFIVVSGDDRAELADRLVRLRSEKEPGVSAERLDKDRAVLTSSPLHVAVVSCAREHPKIPVWEQELSVGAVCMNLVHAANAFGYRAQWLTGWAAFDPDACALYGSPGTSVSPGSFISARTTRHRATVTVLTSRPLPAIGAADAPLFPHTMIGARDVLRRGEA